MGVDVSAIGKRAGVPVGMACAMRTPVDAFAVAEGATIGHGQRVLAQSGYSDGHPELLGTETDIGADEPLRVWVRSLELRVSQVHQECVYCQFQRHND